MLILNILIVLSLFVILASLILGALTMAKPGQKARLKSNKFMQLRVGAQFVAVIAFVGVVYLKSKAGS